MFFFFLNFNNVLINYSNFINRIKSYKDKHDKWFTRLQKKFTKYIKCITSDNKR